MTAKKKPEVEPITVEPQTRRISDVVWQALIAATVTIVISGFTLYSNYKVEQVRVTLTKSTTATSEKLDGIAKVGHETHVLVNSSMLAQLKISAIALRRIAVLTKEADDEAAAALAEKLLKEHEGKQKTIDDGACVIDVFADRMVLIESIISDSHQQDHQEADNGREQRKTFTRASAARCCRIVATSCFALAI